VAVGSPKVLGKRLFISGLQLSNLRFIDAAQDRADVDGGNDEGWAEPSRRSAACMCCRPPLGIGPLEARDGRPARRRRRRVMPLIGQRAREIECSELAACHRVSMRETL
jgi:hypothetical protein